MVGYQLSANQHMTANTPSGSGGLTWTQVKAQERAASKPGAAAPAAPAGPNWNDISGYFDKALKSLTGDTEQMYQQGKRRTLADIAMQGVNAGMANTLNMPAAGIAYDEANRAQTNLALGTQKAGILTGLGQTAAGMYGQNLGAQTQRYGIDVGASSDAASRALQQYIANLQSNTSLQETAMKLNQPQSSGGGINIYTGGSVPALSR